MASKSLPSSFKQKQHSSISIRCTTTNDSFNDIIFHNASSFSWSVKKSSPLATQPEDTSTISQKSWINPRWSTVSGSLIIRQRSKHKSATRHWHNRQKRRTYPPSSDILRIEHKQFFKRPPQRTQQSLAEILTAFYSRSSDSSSSSTKRLGNILKKKGKQPLNQQQQEEKKPQLHVDTEVGKLFQPPATISSKTSTPSTQIKFPTPPKRFSAIYIDSTGKYGKVDYIAPRRKSKTLQLVHLFQHGVKKQKLTSTTTTEIMTFPQGDKEKRGGGGNGEEEEEEHGYENKLRVPIDAVLFLFGFLIFPFWWIGVWVYYRRRRRYKKKQRIIGTDLFSKNTFGFLNCIFSFISIIFIFVILSLIIWIVKS
ncbi:hypothetical protein BD770DRAFT_403061 [Pilaira anomala]|nr:hypothetical protein BD770DRAFT_403061 [Pilaira anomala]